MEALDALTSRISAVRLTEPGPDAEQLRQILYAGACAPDHGRKRPWRFIPVAGADRVRFGELLAQSLQRREPAASAPKLDAERSKAMRAPLILVTVAVTQEDPNVPAIEQIVAVAAATQNILLAAHAMGFGSFWRTGRVAHDEEFKKALGFSPADEIVGVVYIGTTEVAGRPRPEVDLEAVTLRW